MHTRISGTTPSGVIFSYQMATDLLQNNELEVLLIDTPLDDDLSDAELDAMAEESVIEFLSSSVTPIEVMFLSAEVLMGAIDILMMFISKLPTPNQLAALYVLMLGYTVTMGLAFYMLWDAVLNHVITPKVATRILITTVWVPLALEGIVATINAFRIYNKWWNYCKKPKRIANARTFVFFAVYILVLKMLFGALSLVMVAECVNLQLQCY